MYKHWFLGILLLTISQSFSKINAFSQGIAILILSLERMFGNLIESVSFYRILHIKNRFLFPFISILSKHLRSISYTFGFDTWAYSSNICFNTMMNLEVNNDPRRQRLFVNMYLQRLCSPRQMDLDYSLSQMLHIILSPTKVLVLWFSLWCIDTRWLHGENVLSHKVKFSNRNQEPMGAWWSVFYYDHVDVCSCILWVWLD